MQTRSFGSTGEQVSVLGFGAMRLPMKDPSTVDREVALPLLLRAYQLGINYFDTGKWYCGQDSERTLGEALRSMDRRRVLLSTKYAPDEPSASDVRAKLETSLSLLQQSYVDFFHVWGIGWKFFEEKLSSPGGVMDEIAKMKSEGLIRHISFSFHSAPEEIPRLVDTGLFESMLCQYNLLDRSNEEGIAHAKSRGLGVVIMGPVGGGRLGVPSEVLARIQVGSGPVSSPELALRFVLANPNVDVALSGMSSMAQLEENVVTASRTEHLASEEEAKIRESARENARLMDLYCTGCKYCMPCPNEVAISEIFRTMNTYRVWDLRDWAVEHYADIGQSQWNPGKRADACIDCGDCEPRCPQKIPIRAQLMECHAVLGQK